METYRLRQIAMISEDLDATVAHLNAVFDLSISQVQPFLSTWGLRNAILPVGDDILEVVQPITDTSSAARFIKRQGEGGYMLCLQVDDVVRHRKRLQAKSVEAMAGMDREKPFAAASVTLSPEDFAAREELARHHHFAQFHPRAFSGIFVSVDESVGSVDWQARDSEWYAGDGWQEKKGKVAKGFAAINLLFQNPSVARAHWQQLLELPDGDDLSLDVLYGKIVFQQSELDGRISGVDVRVNSPDDVWNAARSRGLAIDDGTIIIAGMGFRPVAV